MTTDIPPHDFVDDTTGHCGICGELLGEHIKEAAQQDAPARKDGERPSSISGPLPEGEPNVTPAGPLS